ncbi:hypothetical protein BFF78_08540 [Streptomyces fodineus]|uniref:CRISPR type III-associated protein domain-containing protein n=1 Tax=Streptomyces fodineus TaxID=1904616 RepID=A0A1D7Y670_9ACTN|nr:RAMP superfamily CRISPR-associated protein [Streptomyces fodineus]AOR31083.1 hypothetical protein BFF78_08540 [Streptomyces fodineus]
MIIRLYELVLTLDTPGAVSAPESRGPGSALDAALPVARDHTGRPAVPATSLAGSLSAHAAAHSGPEAVLFLFGGTRQETDPDDPTRPRTIAVASPVRFLGTHTRLPDTAPKTVHRTRNAIDRHRAAVTPHALFTRELLPPGAEITLWLRLDADPVPPATPAAERVDAHERSARAAEERALALEGLLATWRPVIGGSRGTGHGRARITAARRRTLDLTDPADRRHWLLKGGPALYDDAQDIAAQLLPRSDDPGHSSDLDGQENAKAQNAGYHLLLGRVLAFDVVDALHIGTGRMSQEGRRATDAALLHRDHQDRPAIPGSAWKGLLRSRCEFILHSLGQNACSPPHTQTPDTHGTGVKQDGEQGEKPQCQGTCRICRAFGHTGGRGRLVFLDSPLLAHDAPHLGPDGGAPARVTRRNHIALDRVTAGVAAGVLYTYEVVEQARAELRILDDPPDPAHAPPPDELLLDVLRLALHDLHTGAIGIGHATTRGYGTLHGADDDSDGTQTSPSTAMFLGAAAREARARLGRALFASSSPEAAV